VDNTSRVYDLRLKVCRGVMPQNLKRGKGLGVPETQRSGFSERASSGTPTE